MKEERGKFILLEIKEEKKMKGWESNQDFSGFLGQTKIIIIKVMKES